ncbi:MAG: metallophosphoesterase [Vicinamibacteria bacterium]
MRATNMWLIGGLSAGIGLITLSLSSVAQPTSFTFAAAGDFYHRDEGDGLSFVKTVEAIRADDPDFLLMLGDLSYASDEATWCDYWKTTGKYEKLLLLSGNHDSGEDPGGNINKYISACAKAKVETKGDYGKQYYFDYPATAPLARFIMIVPGLGGTLLGPIDTRYDIGHPGYTFTEAAIKEARILGIKWIVVAMHKNYITVGEKDNEISTDAKNSFLSMLLAQKVDVILQGHEHVYERSKQVTTNTSTCPVLRPDTFSQSCVVDDDNDLVKGAGTVIQILGTGGRHLRRVKHVDSEYPYFASSDATTYGFGKFTVSATTLAFKFQRSAGGTLNDAFIIKEAH